MISLYSGNPGSGKSLHAVKDVLTYSKRDRPVIANFAVNRSVLRNPDRFFEVDNGALTPAFLEDFSRRYWASLGCRVREEEILLVVDECQTVYNARTWNDKSRLAWITFFTQHRKMGYAIILIAQKAEMIDKQIRGVLEYEVKHRKLANAGIGGFLIGLLLGSQFFAKREWYQLRSMGKGAALGWNSIIYGKRVFAAYDTFKTW